MRSNVSRGSEVRSARTAQPTHDLISRLYRCGAMHTDLCVERAWELRRQRECLRRNVRRTRRATGCSAGHLRCVSRPGAGGASADRGVRTGLRGASAPEHGDATATRRRRAPTRRPRRRPARGRAGRASRGCSRRATSRSTAPTNSSAAISAFERPRARSCSTSSSRGVSSSSPAGAAAARDAARTPPRAAA